MKILLLNNFDAGGGAAIAAVRLTQALNDVGIPATLGVTKKTTRYPFVIELPKKHPLLYKHTLISMILLELSNIFFSLKKILLHFRTTNNIYHSTNLKSTIDINWINKSDYDVVNLHWINADMISIKDIAKITKPIVWTMHDSWPCCGAEHHPNILENDNRYITGYFANNKPKSTQGPDICRKVWKQKKKYLMNKNITFIAPSFWEQTVLKESFLFNKNDCYFIPNIIDQKVFTMKDKSAIRKLYNIPENKKIIGFGAAYDIDNPTPNSWKGSYYLIETLLKIKDPNNYFLVIFGPAGNNVTNKINIPYIATGYIYNPVILSTIYNCCDVFINPSLIESMSFTCLESLCCGVPVTAFNVGGIPSVIEHKKEGYLASPYDTDDLLEGVNYCFENQDALSKNCLIKTKSAFDTNITIKKYIEVYKNM